MCIESKFVTAGRAVFTVESASGEWYTYKVNRSKGSEQYKPALFVSLLTGPDNTADFTYLGKLDEYSGDVVLTAKSKYRLDSTPVKVIRWALRHVWTNKPLPAGYAIRHEGRCGRCGRALTVPESIETGIGPECAKVMGG